MAAHHARARDSAEDVVRASLTVINGDRSVIHDKNPLAIVSRKHFYADRDNWKKTYAAEAAQNRK
jgi:hypothetical protein